MAKHNLKLPRMGEGVLEATLTSWVKSIGETIEEGDIVVSVATDKVDNEIPSEVRGTLIKQCFEINDVIQVGQPLAVIETQSNTSQIEESSSDTSSSFDFSEKQMPPIPENTTEIITQKSIEITSEKNTLKSIKDIEQKPLNTTKYRYNNRVYSPLIKTMAKSRGVSLSELEAISGTGIGGKITKDDFTLYLKNRAQKKASIVSSPKKQSNNTLHRPEVQRVPLDRVRKLIAKHMKDSLQTSAHVQSFVEADVTNIVLWRSKIKTNFYEKYNEKITFTPIFVEIIAKALQDFPMMNNALEGDNILINKDINIGMATALPNGNLVVPVIKNANQMTLMEIAKKVNDLANRSRNDTLKPEELKNGTYTFTNIGGFGNLMGTPIINQPQLGILAIGLIQKRPTVVDDKIVIRDKMYLSHSYDHRVVDGALGGMFVKKISDYMEQFDPNRIL